MPVVLISSLCSEEEVTVSFLSHFRQKYKNLDFSFAKTLTLDVFLQAQRLPFLHSSNMAVDTLRGNDECIGFEDILNGKYFVLLL